MCVCLSSQGAVSERGLQMALLRSLCVPRLSFLLLSVLTSSSRHQEALQLADVLASAHNHLHQVCLTTCLSRLFLDHLSDHV